MLLKDLILNTIGQDSLTTLDIAARIDRPTADVSRCVTKLADRGELQQDGSTHSPKTNRHHKTYRLPRAVTSALPSTTTSAMTPTVKSPVTPAAALATTPASTPAARPKQKTRPLQQQTWFSGCGG